MTTVDRVDNEVVFTDDDGSVLQEKDLSPEDAQEYWAEVLCPVEETAGKVIRSAVIRSVPGAWGNEPITYMIFTDGTALGFVHPRDTE